MPINHTTKQPYTGHNANILQGGEWATFIQWRDAGYKVRKGEKGTRLARVIEYSEKKGDKIEDKKALKSFVVFNINQVQKI